jgi:hypothetical protein
MDVPRTKRMAPAALSAIQGRMVRHAGQAMICRAFVEYAVARRPGSVPNRAGGLPTRLVENDCHAGASWIREPIEWLACEAWTAGQ